MKLKALHRVYALLALVAVTACDRSDEEIATDKASIADEAAAVGKADQIDICAGWDWYDDDFCDDPYGWCAQPDPDCGPDGDSCADGWTWSGDASEGCVEAAPEPAAFAEPLVIGQRPSTAFEMRGWVDVAVDDAGDVHVVYPDFARRLIYASPSDGWEPHILDSDLDVHCGLTVVADDRPHVAVIDGEYDLHYLHLDGPTIAAREVVSTYARSIGLGRGEQSHLVFGAGELTSSLASSHGQLGAMDSGAVVSLTNIDEARNAPSVTVGPDGVVHALYGTDPVAYNTSGHSQVRHAWRDLGGSWHDEVVGRATWEGGAVTVLPDGTLVAAYRAFVDGRQTLMIAENEGAQWDVYAPLGEGVLGSAANTSAASDGTLHIVFRRGGGIQHMERAPGGEWSTPVVLDPSASLVSSDRIGLAVGPDGSVHVAYGDTQTRDVRYVSRP